MILGVIIALIVIGVFLWAVKKLLPLVPMDGWIKSVVDVVITVIVVLAIVFYVVIPLLEAIAGRLPGFHF